MSLEGSTPLSHNSNGKAAVAISDVNDNSNIPQTINKSTNQHVSVLRKVYLKALQISSISDSVKFSLLFARSCVHC